MIAAFAVACASAFAPTVAQDAHTEPEVSFFGSPIYGRTWEVARDRRSVVFTTYEELPDGSFEQTQQACETSFSIDELAPRNANEVFVAGALARGGTVVERWTFESAVGGYTSTPKARPVAPIGTPTPPVSVAPITVQGGGDVIPGSQRPPPRAVVRETVLEDSTLELRALGADPEGRFVLVLTESGELRQYLLGDDATHDEPILVADTATVPELAFGSGLMFRLQHRSRGRVWFISWTDATSPDGEPIPFAQYRLGVLEDVDNDGVFEALRFLHHMDPELRDELKNVDEIVTQFSSPP